MSAPVAQFVRREVWSLAAQDLALPAYAKAVTLMQERDASDPTSWSYQAAIHGTHAPSPKSSWNSCEHQTWYFLPWHRMYVYYFEQIVRAAVLESGGPSDWTLPYWDYGLDGKNATLPLAFRNPTIDGAPNPLYVAERARGMNSGATIRPEVTSAALALARPSFTGATEFGGGVTSFGEQFSGETGRLEQTPHNDIHNAVGKGGWMADQDMAAQDPIFWLHHANIDRLWACWISKGYVDPSDPRWTGQSFSFFEASGSPVSKTCAEVLDTIADLGYTYDPPPGAPAPLGAPAPAAPPTQPAGDKLEAAAMFASHPNPEIVGASEAPVRLVGTRAGVTVAIDPRAKRAALAEVAGEAPNRVLLNVEDIEAETNPGSVYGVYVNLPENATGDQEAAHYAGNVSFFGAERARNPRGDEHSHGLRVAMDITGLVHDLRARGQWDDKQIQVTFRPLGLIPPEEPAVADAMREESAEEDPPVSIGRVSVFYG
jgi:tyrosinase